MIEHCRNCHFCIQHNLPIDWRCRYLIKSLPDLVAGDRVDMGGLLCVHMRAIACHCGVEAIWFRMMHNSAKCPHCVHRTTGSSDKCPGCEADGGNPNFKADDE